MISPGLTDFLEALRQTGDLVLVEAEVDRTLEAAEITRRISQAGGEALLFGKIRGFETPLVTNLLGTDARICRLLGVESVEQLARQVAELVETGESGGWLDRLRTSPSRAAIGRMPPRIVKTGACQQVVRLASDVDLGELPAIQADPEETGPAITAAQLFCPDVASRRVSVGRYDLRVLDRNRLGACWLAHDEPARLLAAYRERGERMPVAAVLGGDPVGLLAAMAPLPPGIDVSAVAGVLRGKARELVKCRTLGLEVPTDAEIVLEGYVDPAEPAVDSGPLVAAGGYTQASWPVPVMRVTAVTHRANPVLPAMVPGPVPDEACVVRRFLQRAFLPLVRLAVPELVDLECPLFGAARHWCLVSIRKVYAGQARQVAAALWGMRQFLGAKILVVVDEDVNVGNDAEVWSAVSARVDPGRDVFFHEGPPDPLDPAASSDSLGHRMALDATRKLPGERPGLRGAPSAMPEAIGQRVDDRWDEYGLGAEPTE